MASTGNITLDSHFIVTSSSVALYTIRSPGQCSLLQCNVLSHLTCAWAGFKQAHSSEAGVLHVLPWARDLSTCIRMGLYRSILYQDAVLHMSCSLELVRLIQSLVIPHCAISAVWLQSPRSSYINNHQPHPFQPCLTGKYHVLSPSCKENSISSASLLDFSVSYHLTAALAKLPVCALLHWKRTNPYFWSQSFQPSTAA